MDLPCASSLEALCAGAPDSIVSGEIVLRAGAPPGSCDAVDLRASQERQLAGDCARGDEAAWLELISRYDQTVLRALWQSGAREDADDLLQEVWVRLLARGGVALRSFRAPRSGPLRGFLARVARSGAFDHGRSRRRAPPPPGGGGPGVAAPARPRPR